MHRLDLHSYTPNTISGPEALLEHLDQVRQRGFSTDHEEYMGHSQCIAAPVKGVGGEVVGAVSLSTTLLDLGPEQLEHVPNLLEAARAVLYSMGSHIP